MKKLVAIIALLSLLATAGASSEDPTAPRSYRAPYLVIVIEETGEVLIQTSGPVVIRYQSPPGSPIAAMARRSAVAARTARTLGAAWFRTATTVLKAASRTINR